MMSSRRFSDDQIKSLETTFQAESRPELHLKQHLARKLGLQPRQVAIWFQNKRARSKSKEIEKEYIMLKSSYDQLVSEFDALRKENQELLIQLQRLRMTAGEADKGKHDLCMPSCSDLNMDLIAEGSLPENRYSGESCTFLDCDNYDGRSQWWDF